MLQDKLCQIEYKIINDDTEMIREIENGCNGRETRHCLIQYAHKQGFQGGEEL